MELIGPLQVRVMHHIWSHGPSTVHDVHDALSAERGTKRLAYTTVLTVMRNLTRRKFLAQVPEGRAHRFNASVDEQAYKCQLLRQVREELFRGDLRALLGAVACDESLSESERARLLGMIVAAG